MRLKHVWHLFKGWEDLTGPPERKESKIDMNIEADASTLTADLEELRSRLNQDTENAASLRAEYEGAWRGFGPSDEAKVFSDKQRLDVALSRIEGIQADITQREREVDERQGLAAHEDRRRQAELDFDHANELLINSQAELAKLKAEFAVLPQRICNAEWHFNQALRTLNDAKQRMSLERCRS